MSRRCAFLTTEDLDGFVVDDDLAVAPLRARGWQVEAVPWRRPDVDWGVFDMVVIRSTWDFQDDPHAFVEVLARVAASGARLANPLPMVRWNLRKTYLFDLDCWGVRTVPTVWRPGFLDGDLDHLYRDLNTDELVVKPVVGAGGQETLRVPAGDAGARRAAERAFHGREALVQPFQPSVLQEGEVSLFFLDRSFSHAVRKVPARGEFRSQEEHGGRVTVFQPEASLLRSAGEMLDRLEEPPLYARVDVVRDRSGAWAVMELELVEPSLYLRMDPRAPERFAAALERWMERSVTTSGA